MPIAVRPKNFAEEVLEAKGPVLVDFYGDQCVPCKIQHPILVEISREYKGLKICAFNTDREMQDTDEEYEAKFEIIDAYQVMNLPTMLLFEDGMPTSTLIGLHTKKELLRIFKKQKLKLTPVVAEEPSPGHPSIALVHEPPSETKKEQQ